MSDIDWSKQHCGIHRGTYKEVLELMPDVGYLIADTFPDYAEVFVWDIKVHMLMPDQYPCVPNWHFDNVPRDANGNQDFNLVRPEQIMWVWVSGPPFTEFEDDDGNRTFVKPEVWIPFSQQDKHRGTVSKDFQWRCFIRACPYDILKPSGNPLRRHSQVYLDASNFTW